jgi:hypothetical protein
MQICSTKIKIDMAPKISLRICNISYLVKSPSAGLIFFVCNDTANLFGF